MQDLQDCDDRGSFNICSHPGPALITGSPASAHFSRVLDHGIDSSPFFPPCSWWITCTESRILACSYSTHADSCGDVYMVQGSSVRHRASRAENHAFRRSVRDLSSIFTSFHTKCWAGAPQAWLYLRPLEAPKPLNNMDPKVRSC